MEVIIKFTLDPRIKMEGIAKQMFESDIAQLADAYATRDSIQISYEERYVPPAMDEADRQVGLDLLDKGEITEEEYNNLFQQDHDDQNKEVDDEMDKREREYRSDGHNRPIDP